MLKSLISVTFLLIYLELQMQTIVMVSSQIYINYTLSQNQTEVLYIIL